MEKIRATVLGVMEGLGRQKALPGSEPEAVLKKYLTKKELAHIKVRYFRNGILAVNVDSSGWLYKLSLEKQGLLAKIATRLVIKDIRFILGEIK